MMVLGLTIFLAGSPAEARSVCKPLKPSGTADAVTMALVNGAIDGAKILMGGGQSSGATQKANALRDDDLAKAWFLYQICTLKEAELLSQEKAEELVELVLVGGTTSTAGPKLAGPAGGRKANLSMAEGSGPQGRADVAAGARGRMDKAAAGGSGPRGRQIEVNGARGKVPSSSGGGLDRRAFMAANRGLGNVDQWLGEFAAVEGCVDGGSGLTTAFVVDEDGGVVASGDVAGCMGEIGAGLEWPGAGTYSVVIP